MLGIHVAADPGLEAEHHPFFVETARVAVLRQAKVVDPPHGDARLPILAAEGPEVRVEGADGLRVDLGDLVAEASGGVRKSGQGR